MSARETVGRKPLRKGEDKSGRIDSTAACLILLRDFLVGELSGKTMPMEVPLCLRRH